jgi:hypothetical protein
MGFGGGLPAPLIEQIVRNMTYPEHFHRNLRVFEGKPLNGLWE